MGFKMNWSKLSDDQVKQEHVRDIKYFSHAAATQNGAEDAHARHAAESAEELKRRGINPFDVFGPA
jgi:hypothetical protein